jgi:serine/threonine-protein kinase
VCAKYRVERLIGRGGMGTVMLAHHLRLDESVALKFLNPQAMKKPDVVARFEREARAVVKLKSPHVTRVLDVEVADNGTPFIVMEYLEGQTLAGLVRGGAALPVDLAVEYMLQTCEAVAEAHAMGIVHRDLKPGNLFLTTGADGSAVVKVLDFGVSKFGNLDKSSGAEIETLPDAVVGSPPYMSPEQLRSSKQVDARTDIWSLGVVLFEIVTGRMPFAADNLHEHYTKLMLDPAPLPTQVRADLPAKLDAIVGKCLQREPQDRYANVAELARDLAELAPERARASAERVERTLAAQRPRASSRPSLPAPPIALPPSLHTTNDETKLTAPRRARRTARIVMIVAAASVLAVATFVVTKFRAPTATTATPTATAPPPVTAAATTSATATATVTATATATATVTPMASTSSSMTIASARASTSASTTGTIKAHPKPTTSVKPPEADLDNRK